MPSRFCFICLVIFPAILIPYGVIQICSPNRWAPVERVEQDTVYYRDAGIIKACSYSMSANAQTVCYSIANPSVCDDRCNGSLLNGIISLVPGSIIFIALVIAAVFEVLDKHQQTRNLMTQPTIVVHPIERVENTNMIVRSVHIDCSRTQIELGKSPDSAVPIVIINP